MPKTLKISLIILFVTFLSVCWIQLSNLGLQECFNYIKDFSNSYSDVFHLVRIPMFLFVIWKMENIFSLLRINVLVDRHLKMHTFAMFVIVESIMFFKGY